MPTLCVEIIRNAMDRDLFGVLSNWTRLNRALVATYPLTLPAISSPPGYAAFAYCILSPWQTFYTPPFVFLFGHAIYMSGLITSSEDSVRQIFEPWRLFLTFLHTVCCDMPYPLTALLYLCYILLYVLVSIHFGIKVTFAY